MYQLSHARCLPLASYPAHSPLWSFAGRKRAAVLGQSPIAHHIHWAAALLLPALTKPMTQHRRAAQRRGLSSLGPRDAGPQLGHPLSYRSSACCSWRHRWQASGTWQLCRPRMRPTCTEASRTRSCLPPSPSRQASAAGPGPAHHLLLAGLVRCHIIGVRAQAIPALCTTSSQQGWSDATS